MWAIRCKSIRQEARRFWAVPTGAATGSGGGLIQESIKERENIMKYSEIKKIRKFCEGLHSEPAWREVIEHAGEEDFTVDNVRFIATDTIDEIQVDEMESDSYCLGCFTADAIADATGWPVVLIEAAQKGEAFEEIGEAMDREHIKTLQQIYSRADGYGHHFNRYDFSQEEITIDGRYYFVFDCR